MAATAATAVATAATAAATATGTAPQRTLSGLFGKESTCQRIPSRPDRVPSRPCQCQRDGQGLCLDGRGLCDSGVQKLCSKPGAAHSASFQPSPYESVMLRVHVAPSATANGTLEVYGAPPLSVVPSEQVRLQPTSLGYDPREQVIAEEMVGDAGGDGGDGGKFGAEVLDNRWTSTSESAALQMVMDFTHASVAWSLTVPERVPTMTVE
eukprot:scaffold42168_cov62-Phaeocystis_antarctica.AAC.1